MHFCKLLIFRMHIVLISGLHRISTTRDIVLYTCVGGCDLVLVATKCTVNCGTLYALWQCSSKVNNMIILSGMDV